MGSSHTPSACITYIHHPFKLLTHPLPQQLEYSIYIGTIAVTLLNFSSTQQQQHDGGNNNNRASFVVAAAFTLLAILSLCYSVVIYLYRSQAIRTRRVAQYYDKVGPSVLCGALFVAVALNFVFEGRSRRLW